MRKIILVLMAVLMIAGAAWANTGQKAKAPCTADLGVVSTLVRLNLTDAQKRDLARVFKAHRSQFREALKEMRAARGELHAAMEAEVPQSQAVSAAYKRTAAAGERLMVLLAQIKPQLRAVLTAQQKAVWDNGRREFFAGLSKRIDARRDLFNQWIEEHAN
jgi:Spy/CpxP family protein refolding chaperone